ncbi:MAG: hypothetical protein CMF50_05265 [Legionellales bacterium]|nr:hypothetical protein [Legionellales bacterium]
MALFHKRSETEDRIKYSFRLLPIINYLLLLTLLGAVIFPLVGYPAYAIHSFYGFVAVLVIYLLCLTGAMREINKAMKTKGVMCYGSKFSFRNPLRIVITK